MSIQETLPGGGRRRGPAAIRVTQLGSSHREAPNITRLPDAWIRPTSISSTATSRAGTATSRCSPTTSRCSSRTVVLTISPWTRRRCTRSTSTTTVTRSENLTFQFRFTNRLANDNRGIKLNIGGPQVAVPLKNVGGVSAADNSALNFRESYQVHAGSRRSPPRQASPVTGANGGTVFGKPYDFVGTKTFGSVTAYKAYARFLHPHDQYPGLQHAGPRVRRPAQGRLRGESRPRVRPRELRAGRRRQRSWRRRWRRLPGWHHAVPRQQPGRRRQRHDDRARSCTRAASRAPAMA